MTKKREKKKKKEKKKRSHKKKNCDCILDFEKKIWKKNARKTALHPKERKEDPILSYHSILSSCASDHVCERSIQKKKMQAKKKIQIQPITRKPIAICIVTLHGKRKYKYKYKYKVFFEKIILKRTSGRQRKNVNTHSTSLSSPSKCWQLCSCCMLKEEQHSTWFRENHTR